MATLREKVSAYQEEFENLTPLKDEIEHLREQTAQQEEKIRRLTADNQDLTIQRDELKQSLERVNARWDGKVKRLGAQLARMSDNTAIGVCVDVTVCQSFT